MERPAELEDVLLDCKSDKAVLRRAVDYLFYVEQRDAVFRLKV